MLRDPKRRAEERLRRSCPQTHDRLWFDDRQFHVQPGPAGGDMVRTRLFVDAPLAARLPVEVFHDVGDVDLLTIQACRFERAIEQLTGGADERTARSIFLIPRLFADEHHPRPPGAFSEDRLRGPLPQLAGMTVQRRLARAG